MPDYAENFGKVSHFSPAISIHQIPFFNPLSGYGSYIFPAVAPFNYPPNHSVGFRYDDWPVYREQKSRIKHKCIDCDVFAVILTIGMLGCFYLFGFIFWLNDYPHGGNLAGMLLAVPIFIYTIIGMTCLFASFLDLPERAGHVIVFTSIPLFFLSGAAWPHASCPPGCKSLAIPALYPRIVQMFIQLNQMGVPTTLILPKLLYLGDR